MQIEKATFGMLQCHPHPGNFSDGSRQFHYCFFMGLSRKQGAPVHEAEQFDIRTTVDEFKSSVQYTPLWKLGMEIQVSHIKRRNVPLFVFPGGVRPPRPAKIASTEAKLPPKAKASVAPQAACEALMGPDGVPSAADEESKVRRFLSDSREAEAHPPFEASSKSEASADTSFEDTTGSGSKDANVIDDSRKRKFSGDSTDASSDAKRAALSLPAEGQDEAAVHGTGPAASGMPMALGDETLATEKLTAVPSAGLTASPSGADELEQPEIPSQVKDSASEAVEGRVGAAHARFCQTGALEELEVLNLCLVFLLLMRKKTSRNCASPFSEMIHEPF